MESARPPSEPPSGRSGPTDDAPLHPLGLTLPQVLGSALASATAAVAASFLGVAGTLIGAVVGSLVATTASAVYAHSLRTAGARLRVVRPPAGSHPLFPALVASQPPPLSPAVTRRRRVRLAGGLVLGVLIALGAITGVERVLGHPISDSTSTGTSVGDAVTGSGGAATPVSPSLPVVPTAPTSGPASSGPSSSTPTETATGTASPTFASTPTVPGTASPSVGPSSIPAPTSPSAAPTPASVPSAAAPLATTTATAAAKP